LAANGIHEGTIRYEIGNASLNAESSIQLDYELSYATEHINAKLNLFANNIDNYIYSRKLNTTQGNDSIRDGYNCYQFQSGNVEMSGGELYIDLHPHPWDWLHFENSFSIVYSMLKNQTDSTRYLPFTPAPKWKSDIRIDISNAGKHFTNSYISLDMEHYFKQDKIYSAYGTETVTPAYTLINAGFGTDIIYRKQKLCSLYISGSNLADIGYQSHLSRLKYAAQNNATGRIGVYNMGRNISFKLLIPINL
jgi:iron complex outermembrane receptor protein